MNTPSCSGPCRQGRERCPTPSACQLPEAEPTDWQGMVIYAVALIALASVLVLSVLPVPMP